jgi:choline dehydrogenase-like flavoprotein
MTGNVENFDYFIVTVGFAVCILANRLSACGKYSVCVIEAGPNRIAEFRLVMTGRRCPSGSAFDA